MFADGLGVKFQAMTIDSKGMTFCVNSFELDCTIVVSLNNLVWAHPMCGKLSFMISEFRVKK